MGRIKGKRKPLRVRPAVEALDDRAVPATLGPTPVDSGVGTVSPINAGPVNPLNTGPTSPLVDAPVNPLDVGQTSPIIDGPVNPLNTGPFAPQIVGSPGVLDQGPVGSQQLGPLSPTSTGTGVFGWTGTGTATGTGSGVFGGIGNGASGVPYASLFNPLYTDAGATIQTAAGTNFVGSTTSGTGGAFGLGWGYTGLTFANSMLGSGGTGTWSAA